MNLVGGFSQTRTNTHEVSLRAWGLAPETAMRTVGRVHMPTIAQAKNAHLEFALAVVTAPLFEIALVALEGVDVVFEDLKHQSQLSLCVVDWGAFLASGLRSHG